MFRLWILPFLVKPIFEEHFNFVPTYQIAETPKTQEKSDKIQAQITSEPAGAEIYIDEKFVGSTPSKITLSAGEHKIKVVRTGFKDWERQVSIEPGSEPTFNAILEKIQP